MAIAWQNAMPILHWLILIELIQVVPLWRISPDSTAESSSIFISSCFDAKWEARMHTKFHWVLHMSGHLRKHKMLPSCFAQERKQKVVQRDLIIGFYIMLFVVCWCLVGGILNLLNCLRVEEFWLYLFQDIHLLFPIQPPLRKVFYQKFYAMILPKQKMDLLSLRQQDWSTKGGQPRASSRLLPNFWRLAVLLLFTVVSGHIWSLLAFVQKMMWYFYMVQIFKLVRFTCILKSVKHVGLYLAAGNFLTKIQVVAMHQMKKLQMQYLFEGVQI